MQWSVTAQRADRLSRCTTGLNLDIKDTPQQINVVTRERMDQLGSNDNNDALRHATRISLEGWADTLSWFCLGSLPLLAFWLYQ